MNKLKKVAETQSKYYGDLFSKHGPTVDAVASAKQIYKDLRFQKLSKVFEKEIPESEFTVHDVGFGLGHYFEFIKRNYPNYNFNYSGSEVVESFVTHCNNVYPNSKFYYRDIAIQSYNEKYDYIIFGGTFYHKVDSSNYDFELFVTSIIKNTFAMANKGIAFNFITDFVDYKYDDLYYAKIDWITKYIRENLSRFFVIDHAYPLYEFTVLVYKEEFMSQLYHHEDFKKYFRT